MKLIPNGHLFINGFGLYILEYDQSI